MIEFIPFTDFIAAFGDDPLRLPDVVLEGSNRDDWALVADAVDALGQDSRGIREFAVRNDGADSVAVYPIPGVRLNFFDGDEVGFDLDLREIVSQVQVDAVCDFVRKLGRATNRTALLLPEGGSDSVVRYSPVSDAFEVLIPPDR